jgi:hypothetical protein
MSSFGFIMTRHVNSVLTNNYWNHSVKLLHTFYPDKKIVIIDDNSNQDLVKAEFDYPNIEIIQSEFPGRGELLPYYYYIKNKFFDNAIIIHDSVFFHIKINFEKLENMSVLPLWHFNKHIENKEDTIKIASKLRNYHIIKDKLTSNDIRLGMKDDVWYGCFGCQSFINHNFLFKQKTLTLLFVFTIVNWMEIKIYTHLKLTYIKNLFFFLFLSFILPLCTIFNIIYILF